MSANNSSLKKPLLEDDYELEPIHVVQVQNNDNHALFLNYSKKYIFVIGLLAGVLIQLSTLGVNFLLMSTLGAEYIKSSNDLIIFSIIWSIFTSTMAILFLGFIRNMMEISYYENNNNNQENDDNDECDEEVLRNTVLFTEYRFVVGTLIGVFMAWIITDLALGMRAEVYYSMITLAIALSFCQVIVQCFTNNNNDNNKRINTSNNKKIVMYADSNSIIIV